MIEIRTIRHGEGEVFLGLLCDVFELDYPRAFDVFFSEPMFDITRKWALFDAGEIVSILTTTPLLFGWGRAFGIAGVATRRDRQGEGLASRLLRHVLRDGERNGEPAAMLFAREVGLYERNGFAPLDRVIRGEVRAGEEMDGPILESEEIELIYDNWSLGHPDRLRRDARRWNYWKWNYRIATDFGGGYICHEPNTLREAIFTPGATSLPVPPKTDWFGTALMSNLLEIPLVRSADELILMGRHVPGTPQLFMTDQF